MCECVYVSVCLRLRVYVSMQLWYESLKPEKNSIKHGGVIVDLFTYFSLRFFRGTISISGPASFFFASVKNKEKHFYITHFIGWKHE